MAKAMSGDMKFSLSQTTAAPTVAECTAAAQVYNIVISLTTAAGELHSWYNGKVLLAIADTDNTGVASIDPAAGERAMTNGVLEVEVTMSKAAWTANKTATLTVSDLATAGTGILGFVVADKTFVATVAA
ncbi:MAG: hypothetical protein EOL90_13510 [Spartobacteria bacterium]|nr:hypothetical protein [Spartobacteria bacterium]